MYQQVRQQGPVIDREFQIELLDPEVEVRDFTNALLMFMVLLMVYSLIVLNVLILAECAEEYNSKPEMSQCYC